MKKKIGIIEIYKLDSNGLTGNLIKEVVVWGSLFKGNTGDLISGIYMAFTPDEIKEYWKFIHKTISRGYDFRLKYHKEFWGEYYHLEKWGKSDKINIDNYIHYLKYTIYNARDNKYLYKVNISKDFQYVIDANIIEKI